MDHQFQVFRQKRGDAASRFPAADGQVGRVGELRGGGQGDGSQGVLVPLSDYGRDGASIQYKAWACTNPECGFHIRIDNGELSAGKELKESYK